jgi:hypothetical protein
VAIDPDLKLQYAAIYVLKKLDLKPEDGGLTIPILMPPDLAPIEDVVQELVNLDYLSMNKKKDKYELTKQGVAYIGELIDEAEALVDEFDEWELEDAVVELRRRNLDVFRARFLWGWYDGEFDDLVAFQQRRGVTPVERMWAYYLMSDDFWEALRMDTGEALLSN